DLGGEGEGHDPIGARITDQLHPIFKRGQVAWRDLGAKYRDRVGMERHNAWREGTPLSLLRESRQQMLVTPVHPVEHADSQGRLWAGSTGAELCQRERRKAHPHETAYQREKSGAMASHQASGAKPEPQS